MTGAGRKRSEPYAEESEGDRDGTRRTDTQKAHTPDASPGSVVAVEYHLSYARPLYSYAVCFTRTVTRNMSVRPRPRIEMGFFRGPREFQNTRFVIVLEFAMLSSCARAIEIEFFLNGRTRFQYQTPIQQFF